MSDSATCPYSLKNCEKSFSEYIKNFPNSYKSEIIFQIWNLSG